MAGDSATANRDGARDADTGIAASAAVLVSRPVAHDATQREGAMGKQTGLRTATIAVTVLTAASFAAAARASFHAFQVAELYSSADGTVQFVELHESLGFNGEQFLAGHTLTSKQGATTRTYTFPANLPNAFTANKRVLIATSGFAALGIVTPDYIVPTPFLFPGGGTIDYAGVDVVTYPALPTDGVTSLNRSGVVGINSPTNYAGQTGSIGPPAPPAAATGVPTLGSATLVALSVLLALVALGAGRLRQK